MKNIICAFLLLAGLNFFGPVNAQTQETAIKQQRQLSPEQRADRRAETLKAKLMLTEDQTTKVRAAALKAEQSRSENQEKTLENRKAFDQELRSILNQEQLEKYEAMKNQRKEQVKTRMEKNRVQQKQEATEAEEGDKETPKN